MNHRLWVQAATSLVFIGVSLDVLCAGMPSSPAVYRSDRILVKPKRGVAAEQLATLHSKHHARVRRVFKAMGNLEIVDVSAASDLSHVIAGYQQSGLVEFAEPDYLIRAAVTEPNDPKYLDGTLWGLNNTGQNGGRIDADIDAPEAWDIRTSASNIVVAVLDTGVRSTHEDLAANMWTNPVDGSHGWNVLSGTNNPVDDNGHGTLVSGVLGAVGNNGKGVTGVAWAVQIMAIKCLDSSGTGGDSDLIMGMDYARTNGARILNTSLDSPAFSLALSNAIQSVRDAGIILVTSAGNNAVNLDTTPRYPCCYQIDNIVSVAASSRTDNLWSLSNYGATNVDLAAPGEAMYSTFWLNDSSYLGNSFLSGTSLAAPYVTGSLALLLAKYPGETHQQIIARLLNGVDPAAGLVGKCVTGGRLNLRNALSPPVLLTALPSNPGEPFRLRISGGPDRIFVILTTSDLQMWTPLEINITGPDGYFDFTDSDSTNVAQRFYQVFAEP